MRTLIVYESMFGNTERVAQAVAEGFGDAGADATLVDVTRADAAAVAEYDVLVLGGPTHGFSMSRRSTREDAVRQGAGADQASVGIREWLGGLGEVPQKSRPVAAVFDTRVEKVRHLPGSAARRAARALRSSGLAVLDRPTSFYVTDLKGPLSAGELDRARSWGRTLAHLARTSPPGAHAS